MVTQLDSGVYRVSLCSLSHSNRFTLTPNTPPLPLAHYTVRQLIIQSAILIILVSLRRLTFA